MELSKREIWMLHYMLDFYIVRYIMCNSKGRVDGGEKADHHIAMSEALAMFILCEGTDREITRNVRDVTMKIHDYLADILTDRMDEVIDYPINKIFTRDDFDLYSGKFFDVIVKNFDGIVKIVEKELAQENN